MSIRCGFFNSINNDRTYDAEDMGKIFEGVINDGVFYNYGNKFKIEKLDGAIKIKILDGKAWFYNKYFEIVNYETLTLNNGDLSPRIDAVCIKLDNSSGSRAGSLVKLTGTADNNPVKPIIPSTDTIKYIPIAYITVPANATSSDEITINSNIGTDECPWATTTIDPRRGMFIYDGESSVDPTVNKILIGRTYADSTTQESGKYYGNVDVVFDTPFPEGTQIHVNTEIYATPGTSLSGASVERKIIQNLSHTGFRISVVTSTSVNDIVIDWMAIAVG